MPNAISGRGRIAIIAQSARTIGVELPTEIAVAVDKAAALEAAAGKISGSRLAHAVLDTLEVGKDYHADKEVGRHLLDHVLVSGNIAGAARERSNAAIEDAVVACADAILTGWADKLDPHSDKLTAAAAAGALPANLADHQTIGGLGSDALHHAAAAREAVKLWEAAITGFQMIADAAHLSVGKRSPLVLTAADAATCATAEAAARRDGVPVDAWLLARHGIPLRLATLSDFQERKASRDQQRQALAAEAEKRRDKEQQHGVAV
jgi:hypothetical protein